MFIQKDTILNWIYQILAKIQQVYKILYCELQKKSIASWKFCEEKLKYRGVGGVGGGKKSHVMSFAAVATEVKMFC